MNKIFFGIVGFILLMIIIIIILAGGGDKKPANTGPVVKSLPSYSQTGAAVSWTQQGIVNGEDIHRSIRITVSSSERTVQVISGYSGQVISSQVFPNSEDSYDVFLRSLAGMGFLTRSKDAKKVSDNENGYCPLGQRYIYELNNGADELSRLWSSSCGTKVGTFGGSASGIRQLFQLQITNYNKIVSGVNLSASTSQ